MTGNEVVAHAALAAQADIMYGYPITPQNEIMQTWTRLASQEQRGFLQTEDELSAGFATIGGVLAGRKSFTATAGPGTVLMQEPLSMAEAMRIPVVVIVQQRGGPSTATVIYSQQEVTLTALGGNGEGLRVVYSTSSHQELYDYTIKAFNTAWKYRFPTFVLGDGYQAKMRESLILSEPGELVPAQAYLGQPGCPGRDRPAAHYRNTYNVEEELFSVLQSYVADYQKMAPEIAEWESWEVENSDLTVIAHGIVARAAKEAVGELRKQGFKVGYFRPVTLRPLPLTQLKAAAAQTGKFLVAESAQGQFARLLKEALYGSQVEIVPFFRPGLGITAEEIQAQVMEVLS